MVKEMKNRRCLYRWRGLLEIRTRAQINGPRETRQLPVRRWRYRRTTPSSPDRRYRTAGAAPPVRIRGRRPPTLHLPVVAVRGWKHEIKKWVILRGAAYDAGTNKYEVLDLKICSIRSSRPRLK